MYRIDKKRDSEGGSQNSSGEVSREIIPQTDISSADGITAKAYSNASGKITIEWDTGSLLMKKGFKIMKSETNSAPVYPDHYVKYLSDTGVRSYVVDAQSGKQYYVRVCRYLGSGCDHYSNTIRVTVQ